MKAGWIVVVLMFLVGGIGSLVSDDAVYTRLLYLSLLTVLVAFSWTRLSLMGLKVERQARLQKASAGDVFEEHFEIYNSSSLLSLGAEVVNESALPGAAGSRVLTRIRGRHTVTYLSRTFLTRRGRFSLGPTTLTSNDPFGLFRASKRFPARETLIVLPAIYDISAFPAAPSNLPGGRVLHRRSSEVTPHAASVREYTPGDPLRSIHWPTSARRGKLMVKEFDQDPQAEVWIILDLLSGIHRSKPYAPPKIAPADLLFRRREKPGLSPSTLEYAICIAASLSKYFIGQKRAVGLAAAGRAATILPPELGGRQEAKIFETLALLEADGDLSLAALASMQARHLKSNSTAILITPESRPDLASAAEDLQRRRLHPIVVLLDAATFGGPPGADAMEKSLLGRGVPVCRVHCGDNIPQTLSKFASTVVDQA